MSGVIRVAAALLFMGIASGVSAGLGPNGLGPNGLGPNGLGPNGLGPNGLGPNGLGPNGLGPNGLGPNGLVINGLGPNGLGPNGLGPNGLDINGLGPNGLGPNGLGPNGLVYVISPAGVQLDSSGKVVRGPKGKLVKVSSGFSAWFDTDPASAAKYMAYFARCAYDATTGIAWLDSTGKTWVWTGQYGLAMASLREPVVTEPRLGTVHRRMTADEGKWVSSCLLAHVNIQGSHQYISLRGSPPNPEGQGALMPTANEQWVVGDFKFGAFFADLFAGSYDAANVFTPAPQKFACTQFGAWAAWIAKSDVVIGRNCDVEACTYPDPSHPGVQLPVLTSHLGFCGLLDPTQDLPPSVLNGYVFQRKYATYGTVDPWYWYWVNEMDVGLSLDALTPLHPIYVNGPRQVSLLPRFSAGFDPEEAAHTYDVSRCSLGGTTRMYSPWCTAAETAFTVLVDVPQLIRGTSSQIVPCGTTDACFSGEDTDPQSYKLVGLSSGQAIDPTLRFTPWTGVYMQNRSLVPDMGEAFTAIIRYQKGRTGAANVWTHAASGAWQDVTRIDTGTGPDIWTATAPGQWEWMQVYPTYLTYDTLTSTYRGKFCDVDTDCAAGLTCDWMANMCQKPISQGVCSDAGCECDPGLTFLETNALQFWYTDNTPICIQPCTGASDCGSGQACISGQCVSPALKIRLSGAEKGESCTGAKLVQGDGESGTCDLRQVYFDWKHLKVACREAGQSQPVCRGELVFDYRGGKWGWFCAYGGKALHACLDVDAPDLDAVAYIPGKPWCAPADAKSFVGVCK